MADSESGTVGRVSGTATTIDVHAHVIDRDCFERIRTDFPDWAPTLVERDGITYVDYPDGQIGIAPQPPGIYDVNVRLAEMNEQRVDVQAMSIPPYLFFYEKPADAAAELARIQNDMMFSMSDAYPDRLHVLATLPMQDAAAALNEIERIVGIPRLRGVELGSNVDQRNLDDPLFEPVWDALEAANLPVLVHSDARAGVDRMRSYYLKNFIGNPVDSTIAIASLIFGGVVERHPGLRFCFVHGGGFAPYQIGRWDHGWGCREEARVHIKQKPSTYFQTLYMDTLTLDQLSLEFLGDRMGWDHVLLGSDYPFDMADEDPVGRVEALQLGADDHARVLGRNAQAFLRPLPESS